MEATKSTFIELRLTDEVINRFADLGYTLESLQEAISNHEWKHESDSPALYCGTYGKYNSGNFNGMWVNVSTFDSYDDFKTFCLAIHADEEEPELMYQDGENIPDSLCSESMGEEEFNNLLKYCELCDEYSVSAVDDFLEWFSPEDFDRMDDSYMGVYDSKEDFAREIVNDCYDIEKMMGSLADYFDYEAFARDLFMGDYYFGSHGTVLRAF